MADAQVAFPIEVIPNEAAAFMRAHKTRIRDGLPTLSAFVPKGNGGLSVDWDKYSTPEEARSRGKVPGDNAIIRMGVGDIRQIEEGIDIKHKPLSENRAHSEIGLPSEGPAQAEIRVMLNRIATIILPISM